MKNEELPNRTSIHNHMATMMETSGWAILIRLQNEERERIIKEGMASRADEKGKKMWATLEGFDRAVLMAEKILNSSKVIDEINTGLEE